LGSGLSANSKGSVQVRGRPLSRINGGINGRINVAMTVALLA
jgi:hypothetical protein